MKILITILLTFSFQLQSQIPDSVEYEKVISNIESIVQKNRTLEILAEEETSNKRGI